MLHMRAILQRFAPLSLGLSLCLVQGTGAAGPAGAAPGYPVRVGQAFRDRPFAPELVVIPAGSFVMGSTEAETTREGRRPETAEWERPQHAVNVDAALGVGKYLVTRREFAAFVAATHRPMTRGCTVLDGTWQQEDAHGFADPAFAQTDLDPATCVAVEDAEAYAGWLSTATGHRYRLPREAEWEYAARAGTSTSRWWGDARDTLCAHANGADRRYAASYAADPHANTGCDDGFVHTNPGDAFPANPFGLHDMLGNVWEWTADCFVPNYRDAPSKASAEITAGDCSRRMIRGGSWHNSPDSLRSAARFWLPPGMHSSSLGFRIVRLPAAAAGAPRTRLHHRGGRHRL